MTDLPPELHARIDALTAGWPAARRARLIAQWAERHRAATNPPPGFPAPGAFAFRADPRTNTAGCPPRHRAFSRAGLTGTARTLAGGRRRGAEASP